MTAHPPLTTPQSPAAEDDLWGIVRTSLDRYLPAVNSPFAPAPESVLNQARHNQLSAWEVFDRIETALTARPDQTDFCGLEPFPCDGFAPGAWDARVLDQEGPDAVWTDTSGTVKFIAMMGIAELTVILGVLTANAAEVRSEYEAQTGTGEPNGAASLVRTLRTTPEFWLMTKPLLATILTRIMDAASLAAAYNQRRASTRRA